MLRVERLSPSTLVGSVESGAFELGASVSLQVMGAALQVGPLEGTVVEREAPRRGASARVRVAFESITLVEGRAVLALLEALRASNGIELDAPHAVTEVVRDPARVAAILRQLFELGCDCRFVTTTPSGASPARGLWARPEEILPGQALPLVWQAEPPCPAAPFDVHVSWMNWDFRFRVDEAESHGGRVLTSAPTTVERVRERFQRRAAAPEGATLSFRHPAWPTLVVRQPLCDVSLNGVSFSTVVVDDGVFPGLELPFVEVAWPSGELARFFGTVRRVAPSSPHDGMVAGVALVPLSDEDGRIWRGIVDRLLYRHTSQADAQAEPMWALYERSGYFNLAGKSPEEFAALKRGFTHVATQLNRPNDVGVHVVFSSRTLTRGALTVVKPYEHGWCPCQLAKQAREVPHAVPGRRVLLEVSLHALEHMMRDPSFRWKIAWAQDDARFSREVLYDVTRRQSADPNEACIIPFRTFEGRTDAAFDANALEGYEVEGATGAEIRALVDVIMASRPPSYCEAHDFVPDRVLIESVERRWQGAGLKRRRRILVARERGVAVAAGVLELVEDGVHLFGLLDVLRTFALAPGGERAFGAIVEAARVWYREQGKRKFVYFVEHDDFEHAVRAGLSDLGRTEMLVLSSRYMPDLLQRLWEATAPKDEPPLHRRVALKPADALSDSP